MSRKPVKRSISFKMAVDHNNKIEEEPQEVHLSSFNNHPQKDEWHVVQLESVTEDQESSIDEPVAAYQNGTTSNVPTVTASNGLSPVVAIKKQWNKKGNLPSSRGTVLTIVGFFLSGVMLMLSGIIVLAIEKHRVFRIAGGIFLSVGSLFVLICMYLQQKNINKLRKTLKHDVFKLFGNSDKSSSLD